MRNIFVAAVTVHINLAEIIYGRHGRGPYIAPGFAIASGKEECDVCAFVSQLVGSFVKTKSLIFTRVREGEGANCTACRGSIAFSFFAKAWTESTLLLTRITHIIVTTLAHIITAHTRTLPCHTDD